MNRCTIVAALVLLGGCTSSPAEVAPPPGGGGGAGGGGGECSDLGPSGSCAFQGFGSGCAEEEVCTVSSHPSCGAASCCTLAFGCEPRAGPIPPGFRCEDDTECASGLCVSVGGVGSCLRACDGSLEGCPSGGSCALLALDGSRSVRHCVGTDEAGEFDGGRTLCAADRDCLQDRYCAILEGEGLYLGKAHGRCVVGPRPAGSGRACEAGQQVTIRDDIDGRRGVIWSEMCGETGLCHAANNVVDGEGGNCIPGVDEPFCRGWRCVQPCVTDLECPSRYVCAPVRTDEQTHVDPDLNFKICRFPNLHNADWGCFDETDCCRGGVQRHGTDCCNQFEGACLAPPPDVTHCRVELLGTRFLSRCTEPTGLAELGAACASHAACESGLCDPAAGCTSPCDAGDGDRCAELLPGSSCCALLAGEACVPACRTDCGAPGGCSP